MLMKESSFIVPRDRTKETIARVRSFFETLRTIIPENVFSRLIDKTQKTTDAFAIDPAKYTFDEKIIAPGGECHVYTLHSLEATVPSLVIKIDTCKTRNIDTLFRRAQYVQHDYETLKEWYQAIPTLIPEEYHFIGKTPPAIGHRSAFFTLQKFFGNADNIQDVFRGIDKETLLQILRTNTRLQADFRKFVDITKQHAVQHDAMVDTLGDKNVALIQQEKEMHLMVLDPHHILHPATTDRKNHAKLMADLQYLEDIVTALDSTSAS